MSSPTTPNPTTPSNTNSPTNLSTLFSDLFSPSAFKTLSPQKQALAIILPILGLLVIIFLCLLIVLFVRKRYLKGKLNGTPKGVPPDSDGEGSTGLASPDLIERPSSA